MWNVLQWRCSCKRLLLVDLIRLERSQYGEDDARTVRAIEVCNCLQRLSLGEHLKSGHT